MNGEYGWGAALFGDGWGCRPGSFGAHAKGRRAAPAPRGRDDVRDFWGHRCYGTSCHSIGSRLDMAQRGRAPHAPRYKSGSNLETVATRTAASVCCPIHLEKRNALCHHPRHPLQPSPSGRASTPTIPFSAVTSSVKQTKP